MSSIVRVFKILTLVLCFSASAFAANGPLYGGLVRFGYDFQNNLRVNIFSGVTNAERYSALLGDYNTIFQTTTRAFYGTYGLGLAYKINDKFDVNGDTSYVDLGSNGANGLSYSSTTKPPSKLRSTNQLVNISHSVAIACFSTSDISIFLSK